MKNLSLKELSNVELKQIDAGGPIGDFAERLGRNIAECVIDYGIPVALGIITRGRTI